MEKGEFYTQNTISQEEIGRLEKIEYPNFVSETILNRLNLTDKKVLDSGAGPNAKLAEFVARKGGRYVPVDIRADVLQQMQSNLRGSGTPFYGVQSDVRNLPFTDGSFDVVHQRFVFMNIAPASRRRALEELLRVGKENLILLEYNWRKLRSTDNPKTIDKLRELAFSLFSKFSIDPYMGEQFDGLLRDVDPDLHYSLQGFEPPEDAGNTPELMLHLRGMYRGAKDGLRDEALAEEFRKLIEELEASPIAFVPPEVVAAFVVRK